MRIKKLTIGVTVGMVLTVLSTEAQQAFQNLDFEQANPVIVDAPPYPDVVTAASALPFWTVYLGSFEQTQVVQNIYSTGQASVDIFGPNYPAAETSPKFLPGTIDGNYSVLLQAGAATPIGGDLVNASIAQYGTVPLGSQSLQFEAWTTPETEFSVSFAGNILSPVVLGSGANYTLYGVNISSYAGDSGTLEFTSIFNTPGMPELGLDDISFSPTPEPGTLALILIGGAVFGTRRWRAKGA